VIVVYLCRIFFTGAFRRPRELNWFVGITLLLLALLNGFTGYSLPDDLLSGTGLRIAYSIVLSVPIVGEWAAFLLFGGEFPANNINSRLFVIHVMIVPAVITGLLAVHLAILWRQKHTHFPGPGRKEGNVVGLRLWPSYATKSVALFSLVVAVVGALGGLAQINPVWLYGPFRAPAVSTAAQPDWYVGWLEGALRLAGPWRVHLFGRTISEVFWPAVLMPLIVFLLLYAWPFLERALTGDHAEHHLLDRPRDHPVRTAFGIATLTFFAVLTVAGAQDIVAQELDAPILTVNNVLRVLVFVLPIVFGVIAWRFARDLRAGESLEAWAAKGEPATGPAEPPVAEPVPARTGADGASRDGERVGAPRPGWLRRTADALVGTLLVAILVRAGRRRNGSSGGRDATPPTRPGARSR
jgi:ubiquinol-cytochrome c reductase cytochrome b subunit